MVCESALLYYSSFEVHHSSLNHFHPPAPTFVSNGSLCPGDNCGFIVISTGCTRGYQWLDYFVVIFIEQTLRNVRVIKQAQLIGNPENHHSYLVIPQFRPSINPFHHILLWLPPKPCILDLSIRKGINEHQESLLFADPCGDYIQYHADVCGQQRGAQRFKKYDGEH